MSRMKKNIFLVAGLLLLWRPVIINSITLSSFYPAPYGAYNQLLITGNTLVGDSSSSTSYISIGQKTSANSSSAGTVVGGLYPNAVFTIYQNEGSSSVTNAVTFHSGQTSQFDIGWANYSYPSTMYIHTDTNGNMSSISTSQAAGVFGNKLSFRVGFNKTSYTSYGTLPYTGTEVLYFDSSSGNTGSPGNSSATGSSSGTTGMSRLRAGSPIGTGDEVYLKGLCHYKTYTIGSAVACTPSYYKVVSIIPGSAYINMNIMYNGTQANYYWGVQYQGTMVCCNM